MSKQKIGPKSAPRKATAHKSKAEPKKDWPGIVDRLCFALEMRAGELAQRDAGIGADLENTTAAITTSAMNVAAVLSYLDDEAPIEDVHALLRRLLANLHCAHQEAQNAATKLRHQPIKSSTWAEVAT